MASLKLTKPIITFPRGGIRAWLCESEVPARHYVLSASGHRTGEGLTTCHRAGHGAGKDGRVGYTGFVRPSLGKLEKTGAKNECVNTAADKFMKLQVFSLSFLLRG